MIWYLVFLKVGCQIFAFVVNCCKVGPLALPRAFVYVRLVFLFLSKKIKNKRRGQKKSLKILSSPVYESTFPRKEK